MCDHGFIGPCGECDGSGQVPTDVEEHHGLEERRHEFGPEPESPPCPECGKPSGGEYSIKIDGKDVFLCDKCGADELPCPECAAAELRGEKAQVITKEGHGVIRTSRGLAVACSADGRSGNGGRQWTRPVGR